LSRTQDTRFHRVITLEGLGGTVAVCRVPTGAVPEGRLIGVEVAAPGIAMVVGLEDDELRRLVGVLELELRNRTAARLDPATACLCRHPRAVHVNGEGACRDEVACPCLVMRAASVVPATVQSCTVAPTARGSDLDFPRPLRRTV
jgi:hypothetical protein